MKKLIIFLSVCLAVCTISCSKQTEGSFFVRVENLSYSRLEYVRICRSDSPPIPAITTEKFVTARLNPGDTSGVVCIDALVAGSSYQQVRLRARVNGKEAEITGFYRCWVGGIGSPQPGMGICTVVNLDSSTLVLVH